MTGSATADKRLNPDSDLVRGCGGIGIIWNKQLKAHPIAGIDSDRICAITIESSYSPLVIGAYLPTTNYPTEDFCNCLHTVVLAGDYNAHVSREGGPKASGIARTSMADCC